MLEKEFTLESIAGYVASGLIGVSLGLIGGGGSIITIPVLVYLFHIEPTVATAYSLFIVGTTSLVGGVRSALQKMVDFKSALLFSIPSTLAVYFTRHYFLPLIPDVISHIGNFELTKNTALMLFFSVIMVLAAIRMIVHKHKNIGENLEPHHHLMIILQGLLIGVITGIVGAGGGFLIIPALVLLVGIPMKKAVGTSLIIIAINSLIGFFGDITVVKEINFLLMTVLSVLAIGGVFLGSYLSRFIKGKNLKAGFGWFALTMAFYIIIREITV